MPAAMVQLTSCGNIFVPISSSEGRQVTSAMRIPPQQRPAGNTFDASSQTVLPSSSPRRCPTLPRRVHPYERVTPACDAYMLTLNACFHALSPEKLLIQLPL
jgi:hypothetical protein